MAGAAGVAGEVHPLGKVVDAPQARGELPHPLLPQLGTLVQKDHVVLRALIAVHVAVAGAVAELQGGAVEKAEHPLGGPVLGHLVKRVAELADVVALQLLIGAPHDEQPDAGIPQSQQHGLGADGPGFPAAPRPAECGVFDLTLQKQPLLLVGVGDMQRDGIFVVAWHDVTPLWCDGGCRKGADVCSVGATLAVARYRAAPCGRPPEDIP